ncbi:hypothetical protein Avbf_09119 [Armadillidium vulgare]|nr:hypothetical protein Avbf_09119 [Armadillidium vulgare]
MDTEDFFWKHSDTVCLSVSKRNSSVSIISEELYFNDFCEYLCSSNLEYICHTYHLSKPFVFTFYEEGKTQKHIGRNEILISLDQNKKIVNSTLFPRILGTCKNFYAVQYAKLIGNPFPLTTHTN